MNFNNKVKGLATLVCMAGLALTGCQKLERPELVDLVLDPPPPAYSDLKSFWAFENNANDAGENNLTVTETKSITYVAGVNGQAAKIGAGGYILLKAIGDTVEYPNGFKGIPADTLSNLGSFTVSFWMNGAPGPITTGAQGVFSLSHGTEFWGNMDIFLENYDGPGDNDVWFKIHMFNAGVASGNGEQWIEGDATKLENVLGKWTHIAMTYDGATSTFALYKDGVAEDTRILSSGAYGKVKFNNFNGAVLGTYQFQTTPSLTSSHGLESWARSFDGALDQFRIYNRPLSATEINALFTAQD